MFRVDRTTLIPTLFDIDYGEPFHANSQDPLGRAPDEYPDLKRGDIDAFVQSQIYATGGALYKSATLKRYPMPRFPLQPMSRDATIVDVGAGWGRWSLAAASEGWCVTAIDPWIDCCRAHARVARQFAYEDRIQIANADGRRLPLEDDAVDAAFSYSVLQHLPKPEARLAMSEMVRVVRRGGTILVQMPNVAGVRQRHMRRRGAVADEGFKVRPWTYAELAELAAGLSTTWSITVDGFFSLNPQWSERSAMPLRSRVVVGVSEVLRRVTIVMPRLVRFADSLWLELTVDP